MSQQTSLSVEEIAKAVRQWIASPEGQSAVEAGLRRAEAMTEEFRKVQKVDWWLCLIPVDI